MPRYRTTQTVLLDPRSRNELVERLAAELRVNGGGPARQPFIFEQEVPHTGTYYVLVVWERWNEVPPEERASIITEAYERAEPDLVPNLTVVVGATLDEAIQLNLLPYEVIASHRKDDPVSLRDLSEALREEGAIDTRSGTHLRYPTRQMAEEALRRLSERIPGPYWSIQQTISQGDD